MRCAGTVMQLSGESPIACGRLACATPPTRHNCGATPKLAQARLDHSDMSEVPRLTDNRPRDAALVAMASGVAAACALVWMGQSPFWALVPALAAWIASAVLKPDAVRRASSAALVAEPEGSMRATKPPAAPVPLQPVVDDMVENFALPLLITGANEIVMAASSNARRLFPGLAPGRPVSLAIRDPDFLEALVEISKDGVQRDIMLVDGTAVARSMRALISSSVAKASTDAVIICVFEDLTEQRATERMRVDFIANASHELRTPLASLLGFIETLQGPARDDATARERFLPIMREQAGRMARLIDDLLSLSRAELRAHQQPVALIDLRSIVREIVDSLSLSAKERRVALDVSLPDEAMLIRGDRDDLLRLVENLVENGIRYGRDGKKVEIDVTAKPNGEKALSIRDHGPGIDAQHIPRLTERFYRADVSHSREIGGTGLGLAIVKHLVVRHRARLEIESRLGEGATFRVIFPASDS